MITYQTKTIARQMIADIQGNLRFLDNCLREQSWTEAEAVGQETAGIAASLAHFLTEQKNSEA